METCICQFYIYTKSRIALQVARKIAPCDRALLTYVCLAYLFLHSGQVHSSFKCYFKRKYLNLIDSNCDVDESCLWFFIGTVLATGPECIINIYVILGRRILFEMGAVRSARESRSVCVGLTARNVGNGRVVLCTWETIIASSGLQLLWEEYVFWGVFCVHPACII